MKHSDLLTYAAAAREMGVTRAAVDWRVASGQLPVYVVYGKSFVSMKGLTVWKKARLRRALSLVARGMK
jgi:hypothetical protein